MTQMKRRCGLQSLATASSFSGMRLDQAMPQDLGHALINHVTTQPNLLPDVLALVPCSG